MTTTNGLMLTDPEGSRMMITRIDDIVFTVAVEYAGDQPFRMFEEDRSKLREFLRPLVG